MEDLSQVRQRREALLGAVAMLEAALAAPASDARWCDGLGDALAGLRATLDEHVAESEGPDGILAQVREKAPRLSSQIDRMLAEHVSMVDDTDRLIDRLDHVPTERSTEETEALREQALGILAGIVRHRQRGADLLYEAYDVDVGGPG